MHLPHPDGSFDLVVCRGGLHHLPDLRAAVVEISRVLKKDRMFLAFEPCDDLAAIRTLRRMMYRTFDFFDAEHERGLASREVESALAAA